MKDTLNLRSPNGSIYTIPTKTYEYFSLEFKSTKEVSGQWLASFDGNNNYIAGIVGGKPIEKFGDSAAFEIEMVDTGEEFVLLEHMNGTIIVSLKLSPKKCPLALYHEFLNSYNEALEYPEEGKKSVSSEEESEGRTPTDVETLYRLIKRVNEIKKTIIYVAAEKNKHERKSGQRTTIDALGTLTEWKKRPNWYQSKLNHFQDTKVDSRQLVIGKYLVTPLKAKQKDGIAENLFVSAAKSCIYSVINLVGVSHSGKIINHQLHKIIEYLECIDELEDMPAKMAWSYIQKTKLPFWSAGLAFQLIELRESLINKQNHLPKIKGETPYFLSSPELVFQEFVSVKVLLALGVPKSELANALRLSRKKDGFEFDKFVIWANTPVHGLRGWRDLTHRPSQYAPDLILCDKFSKSSIILDAKFRRDEFSLIPQSGIKEIQSYMHEYSKSKSILALPAAKDEKLGVEVIEAHGNQITGIGFTPSITSDALELLANQLSKCWCDN